ALATMKLLILTCLMAAALAMPRLNRRNLMYFQNQHQNSNEQEQQELAKAQQYVRLNEKIINDLNRVTMDESTEGQAMASVQQEDSSSSSSSEETENAIPNISEAKHISNEDRLNQCTLRQPMSVMDQELAQLSVQAFPQFYQYDAYPYWDYLPQDMKYLIPEAVLNTIQPIVSKNAEKTKVWWRDKERGRDGSGVEEDRSSDPPEREEAECDRCTKRIQPNMRLLFFTFIMAVVFSTISAEDSKEFKVQKHRVDLLNYIL
ncbi:hypothetical protein STEG23_009896, partial [Scotinomys teguina]